MLCQLQPLTNRPIPYQRWTNVQMLTGKGLGHDLDEKFIFDFHVKYTLQSVQAYILPHTT